MKFITRGMSTVFAFLAALFLVSCGGEPDAKLETGTSLSMVLGTHRATLAPGTGVLNPVSLNWVGCPPRAVTLDTVGLPAGVSATFSVNPALTATDLRVDVGPAVPNGTYTFQVRGASDSLLQTQPFTLVVDNAAPSFTAAFSPASLVLDPVLPASTTATITRTGGLTTPITITADLPPGMTYTVASPRIVGSAPAAETYTITLQGGGAVATGSYIAQVHLTAGTLQVHQNIPFSVVPLPTASLSAAATTVTTGTATTLTPTFTGGTATISGLTGPFTSGTPVSTGPLAGSATFTLSVTNATGSTATSSVSITTVAAPTTPVITAPANATTGLAGYTASIPAQTGSIYAWSISGGTITSGGTTTSVTFTAGAVGTLTLGCTVTNAAGAASTPGTANVTVVAAPTTPVITAPANATTGLAGYTASIPAQTGSAYAWSITGGTISAGAGTTSITFTAGAVGTLNLSCTVTNAAGTASTPGTANVTVVAAPTTPVITAPTNATTGLAGYTASILAQAGSTYAWSITGGTITAGAGTTSITFTAGAVGTLNLSCTVTNAAGTASTPGTANVTVVAAPTMPVITAPANATTGLAGYTASIPAQASSTYVWSITGGTITAGAGTTSITFTAGAVGTLNLSCTVTNAAGTASTPGTANVTVVAAPTTPVITAPANATTGLAGYTASIPAQTGSTYAWSISGGTITSGGTTTSVTFTAGAVGTLTLGCTVTNAAGTASTPGTANVNVVAAPVITAFVAATSPITAGGSTTLAATYSGGTGTVDQGVGNLASGSSVSTGALGATTTFTLTVTNAAGTQATSTATVVVLALPVITSFTTTPCSVAVGGTATLSPSFTVDGGGSASISGVAGPVVSGGSYPITLSTPGTSNHTLTVINGAGTSVSQSLSVQVLGFQLSGTLAAGRQRRSHDAVRLPDGRVLLVGGQDTTGNGRAQASVYDPSAGTFADHALLGTARILPTATVLRNGKVLVAGGTTSLTAGPALATAELIDSATGTATPVTASFSSTLSEGRYQHTATLLGNGKVLIVGGWTDTGQGTAIANGAELYDPSNGFSAFSPTDSLSNGRVAHAAVLLPDGRVLVIGGWNGGNEVGQTEIYDPSTGTWSNGPSLATPVYYPTATLLKDGRILVTGGIWNGGSVNLGQVIDAGLTTCVSLFPTVMVNNRAKHRATLLPDGRVLITGGSNPSNAAELFDPTTNTFSATPLQAESRSGHTSTLLGNGRVLLASGENPGGAGPLYSSTGELFVPASCTTQVLIEPAGMKLRLGDTYPFLASVDTPAANKTVSWSIQEGTPSGGTLGSVLGSSVTYTTPTTSGTRNLVATSVGDGTASASVPIQAGPVTIAMNLTSLTQPVNWLDNFSLFVTVKGAVDTSYTLSTDEPGGAFYDGDGGFYQSRGVPGVYHARATSNADPSVYVEVPVTVTALPAITTFTLTNPGANWQLNYAWTLDPNVTLTSAVISRQPTNAQFTGLASGGTTSLGSTLPDDGFVLTVTDSNGGQSYAYIAAPAFGFTISPTSTTVLVGDPQTFTTVETGVSQSYGATWTVVEAGGGTITSGGVYTAPGVAGTYHVTGTSLLNPAFSATATITVRPRIVILPGPGTLGPSSSRILRHALVGLPDHRVTWSMLSAPAFTGVFGPVATVTPTGVFSGSNAEPGLYTILATSVADGSVTATVDITVQNFQGGDGVYQTPGSPANPIYGGRYDFAMANLQDGRVLITGGRSTPSGVADLGYGEVYNPLDPAFIGTGNLFNFGPRRGHRATLLPTGKVLITGGFVYNGSTEDVSPYPELYDPITNQFQYSNSTMTVGRYGHRAELLPNGNVLVVGGFNAAGTPLASAELYDPYLDAWTNLGPMPQGVRTRHALVRLLDNRVLVAGGSTTGAESGITGTAAIFTASLTDTHAGAWSATGSLAQGVADAGVALAPSGKVVFVGGTAWDGTNPVVSSGIQVFDPSVGAFTAAAATLPQARTRPLVVLGLDNLVHVMGGFDGSTMTSSHYQYNPVTEAFVAPSGSLFSPRDGASSRMVLSGSGGLLVFGPDIISTGPPYRHLEDAAFTIPPP